MGIIMGIVMVIDLFIDYGFFCVDFFGVDLGLVSFCSSAYGHHRDTNGTLKGAKINGCQKWGPKMGAKTNGRQKLMGAKN
jgi:hypothetical protein